MARTFESKAVRAIERSDSVRTTVPAPVAALLGVEPGDRLIWTVGPGTGRVSVSKGEGGAAGAKSASAGPSTPEKRSKSR